jgi:hypothetical protein
MARGFGFRVYLQPILPQFIDLATVAAAQEARTAVGAGVSNWMDITTLQPASATIREFGLGVGQSFYLSVNPTAFAITNAALASNVATLTIGTHTMLVGNRVKVANLPSPFASLNGTFVITAVASTTVSYALVGANITSASVAAGTATIGTDLKLDGTDAPFRLLGIEDGPYTSETGTEESPTWDDESQGFSRSEPTTKSGSIAFSGLAKYTDSAYNMLLLGEGANVSRSIGFKLARIGPAGFNECRFGYGRFDTIDESNAAGAIVKWSSTFGFDGPVGLVRHQ